MSPVSNDTFGFTNTAQSRLNYIEITYVKADSYQLVTDPTTLGTGDDILLVGKYNSIYSQAKWINDGNVLLDITADAPVNGLIYKKDSATAFKVVREGNYVSFKDEGSGYLSAMGGSNVGIKYVDELSDRTRLNLTIDSNGVVSGCVTKDTSYSHRNRNGKE